MVEKQRVYYICLSRYAFRPFHKVSLSHYTVTMIFKSQNAPNSKFSPAPHRTTRTALPQTPWIGSLLPISKNLSCALGSSSLKRLALSIYPWYSTAPTTWVFPSKLIMIESLPFTSVFWHASCVVKAWEGHFEHFLLDIQRHRGKTRHNFSSIMANKHVLSM